MLEIKGDIIFWKKNIQTYDFGNLPEERVQGIRYLYVAVDSDLNVHYELNNRGHIIMPIHFSEINPLRIYKNLPRNLIKKCASNKKNIVGILQLWIYYTKDYSFARIRAIGILSSFGNKNRDDRKTALTKLMIATDYFCKHYNIKFVETETAVIPEDKMRLAGFEPALASSWINKFAQTIFRQKAYVKKYF